MTELQLFIGGLTRIDEEGQSTGIYKHLVNGSIRIGREGLTGDIQADRRVHGGPDKAVHHYPAENYPLLAKQFPAIALRLVPGSIGENLSTRGWDEHSICIGDTFALGSVKLQVTQPRSPCWKIDHRYAIEGVTRYIADTGLTGWYYRVLETGEATAGSAFELLARLPGAISLAELWKTWREHRPDPERLARINTTPGLTADWRKKLADRETWLRANANARVAAPSTMFHVKPPPSLDN